MKHELPQLPFPKNALEPIISAETLEYHHGKHHKAYVDKLNKLIQGTEYETLSLEEIIRKAEGPLFNNAAQAWNHSFLWQSLNPNRTQPSQRFLSVIGEDFGSFENFTKSLQTAATDLFGSGWAWLVQEKGTGKLKIETASNAGTPVKTGNTPLLALDVWEHAYYIDYRNDRPKYLNALVSILNWDFAEKCMKGTRKKTSETGLSPGLTHS